MERYHQLLAIEEYVKSIFEKDVTGHDYFHLKRVATLAKQIASEEKADAFLTEASAWLHDIGDRKLFQNPAAAITEMNQFLLDIELSRAQVDRINEIIQKVSFHKGQIPNSIEGKIVQDADRLDALGAIGIARTFAYGGAKGQLLHHSDESNTSIQHFYDKLLTLKDTMHTNQAKKIAEQRHQIIVQFLADFHNEWV